MAERPGPQDPPEPPETPDPGSLKEQAKALVEPITGFHNEHPVYFWVSTVATVAAALGIGALVAPELVIDRFLWVHFWGPTAADANQAGVATRHGIRVTEDYTLTSEIVYGLILAGALVSIYVHLFKKRGIQVDDRFIAALLPYIFFGPLWRSMEDASVFCEIGTQALGRCDPGLFSWPFISPFIYVLTAAFVIAHLLLAYRTQGASQRLKLRTVGGWLGIQTLAYLAVYVFLRGQFVVMIRPVTFAALALLALIVYYVAVARGGSHLHWALASWGLPMAIAPMILIGQWEIGSAWVEHARAGVWEIIPIVLGLTALVVAATALVGYLFREDSPAFASFLVPLNLGLVAGHMVDAFATFTTLCSEAGDQLCTGATFLGVSIGGYGEKHPVSELFLGIAEGWGYVVMKFLLVVMIVVLIDRSVREGDEDPDLVGLVKLAVLVLGLAPGVRDVVRVAMGV